MTIYSICGAQPMRLVSIPQSQKDPHWVWKRPKIKCERVSRCMKQFTSVSNISEVAQALNVGEKGLLCYFASECGVMYLSKSHLLFSSIESETLDDILEKFIEKYIVCIKCKNPMCKISSRRMHVCECCGRKKRDPEVKEKVIRYVMTVISAIIV